MITIEESRFKEQINFYGFDELKAIVDPLINSSRRLYGSGEPG